MNAVVSETISKIAAHAALCCILLTSCTHLETASPATVCEIVASPERFAGRMVKVSAVWEISYHYTLLTDPGCPKVAIALWLPEHGERRDSVIAFAELAYGPSYGDRDRTGGLDTFTGQFEIVNDPDDISKLVLHVRSFRRQNIEAPRPLRYSRPK